MLGGGGGCWACFRSGPISVGGVRGSKRSAPLFPGPQGEPAHGLHPRFVVAEIWADWPTGRLPTMTSRHLGGGGWHDAWMHCCLTPAGPIGLSPLTLSLRKRSRP